MYALPLLLCLVPLTTTLKAWQRGRRVTPALSNFRIACFNCGVVISVLTSLVTITCWLDPFPLVHLPNGSESIAWLELAWKTAFGGATICIILALFGKSLPRILLALSGIMLVLLPFGSILQNGV